MKPAEWCCLKVKRSLLGLRSLQIAQMSRFSVICINFAIVFFLMTDLDIQSLGRGLKLH